MKSHNKFLVLTLTALIALSTVACSNKKEAPGASEASSSTEPVITTKETPVETLPVKPDNKDAIEKINAIDVPENIKKIFTDKGRFIDTTQHGKVTTLENFNMAIIMKHNTLILSIRFLLQILMATELMN